jgi:hypothetical protein
VLSTSTSLRLAPHCMLIDGSGGGHAMLLDEAPRTLTRKRLNGNRDVVSLGADWS